MREMRDHGYDNKKMLKFLLRPVLITIALIPLNSYWIAYQEVAWYARLTYVVPFPNVIFTIFLLTALNVLLSRFSKNALTHQELLVIYILFSMASAISNNLMLAEVIPSFGYAYRYATPENEWKEVVWKHLPSWLTVNEKDVLTGYYEGDSSLYDVHTIRTWLSPVLAWSSFTLVMVFVMLCMSVVLRRQWTESERLTYPTIRLPLEMINPKSGFFRNRLMWMGFAVAGGICLINGLGVLYPSIPQIPIKRMNVSHYFVSKPWSAMRPLHIGFYPFIVGIGFLMPLDLSFSCWSLYLFRKSQRVFGSIVGLTSISGFPFFKEQEIGAVIGLCMAALWNGREHLKSVLTCVFRIGIVDDSNEPMRYRTAVLGIIVGFIFLTLFSVRIGMSVWPALSFFIIYYAVSITIARVRAESGYPVHAFEPIYANRILPDMLGSRRFSPGDLTGFALYTWFNRAHSSHPMPHQLEAFKLTDSAPAIQRKPLSAFMMLAVFLGIIACFWAYLDIYHRHGAMSGFGDWPNLWYGNGTYRDLSHWLTHPARTNYNFVSFTGIGAAAVLFLAAMRLRFLWWPFHPLGYVISLSYWINFMWVCLLISSVLKWIIVKFGGLKPYRRASYFFLGLALGDFVIGSLWLVYGTLLSRTVYTFWP